MRKLIYIAALLIAPLSMATKLDVSFQHPMTNDETVEQVVNYLRQKALLATGDQLPRAMLLSDTVQGGLINRYIVGLSGARVILESEKIQPVVCDNGVCLNYSASLKIDESSLQIFLEKLSERLDLIERVNHVLLTLDAKLNASGADEFNAGIMKQRNMLLLALNHLSDNQSGGTVQLSASELALLNPEKPFEYDRVEVEYYFLKALQNTEVEFKGIEYGGTVYLKVTGFESFFAWLHGSGYLFFKQRSETKNISFNTLMHGETYRMDYQDEIFSLAFSSNSLYEALSWLQEKYVVNIEGEINGKYFLEKLDRSLMDFRDRPLAMYCGPDELRGGHDYCTNLAGRNIPKSEFKYQTLRYSFSHTPRVFLRGYLTKGDSAQVQWKAKVTIQKTHDS